MLRKSRKISAETLRNKIEIKL